MRIAFCVFLCFLFSAIAAAQTGDTNGPKRPPAECPQEIDVNSDQPLKTDVSLPPSKKCKVIKKNGFLLPDPACTPGALNETLSLEVLTKDNFKTDCVRDRAESSEKKAATYAWYKIHQPSNNTGQNQICELDHLVSLELGGADTLDNIWPQCGPSRTQLNARFFKRKDAVEHFLAKQVRDGKISLADAQRRIAEDWTQFLQAAEACPNDDCSNP
jgi:hypothetical protein